MSDERRKNERRRGRAAKSESKADAPPPEETRQAADAPVPRAPMSDAPAGGENADAGAMTAGAAVLRREPPPPVAAPPAAPAPTGPRAVPGTPSGGLKVTRLAPPPVAAHDLQALLQGHVATPHSVLGAHPVKVGAASGVVVRAYHPEAIACEVVLPSGDDLPLDPVVQGFFAGFIPGAKLPLAYRLRFRFADGSTWERGDPYRFMPTLGEIDLHLFNEGTHRRLWDRLGAHIRTIDGVQGVAFAVWAPTARRVSVVGDFNGWDGRIYPMRALGASGVWEVFIPDVGENALYKYEILTQQGMLRLKTDPFAFKMQQAPETASIVVHTDRYRWADDGWMEARRGKDHPREPMLIYEVHLGSWARVPEDDDRSLSYREIAPRLAAHVKALGFTHVELLPISEHPFIGSWGYQVSAYYAPTSRFGAPDDFRFFVDTLHQAGIGIILDWVPAHFPKDDYALRRFDGSALFEHEDPRLGEHPDWGTLIFNYGRKEVRNFLIANALFWLEEYHIDGLRVDAVASMLYLDYSRKPGQWMRNVYGGRENLDAISFLREMNETVRTEEPGAFTVAEESTAWPGVTKPAGEGGLGFTFKWNMGWMHDTLKYFSLDPIYRRHHQDQITFAMMYEYSERFIMPLSHDEVVHLKGSLLTKMAGDWWQKFANLRSLFGYLYTRPGKKLVFMGSELAPDREWNHDVSLDWHLGSDPMRQGLIRWMEDLGRVYRERPALWRHDPDPEGFHWIDVSDRQNSVLSYVRRDGDDHLVVVLNLTPIPRDEYRIGAPAEGAYTCLLSSDDASYGGSGAATRNRVATDPQPFHGYPQSMVLTLPPLGIVVMAPERADAAAK